jgi:hypothetical protein
MSSPSINPVLIVASGPMQPSSTLQGQSLHRRAGSGRSKTDFGVIGMGRFFRIKLHLRRFSRRHPWLIFTVRSFMIFSAAFGGSYGFIAGSRSPGSGYDPNTFAIGASFLFALACLALATLSFRMRMLRN